MPAQLLAFVGAVACGQRYANFERRAWENKSVWCTRPRDCALEGAAEAEQVLQQLQI